MRKKIKKIVQKILKNLAIKLLSRYKPDIIGITGSAGKSSAKEAIYQVLSKSKRFEGRVKKSAGNLNTEIGLPLAILGFKKQPNLFTWLFVLKIAWLRVTFSSLNPLKNTSILILEYSSDKPGDIHYLLSIARPTVAIITAIGPAHTEFFKSIGNVAKEKGQLIQNLPQTGVGIIGRNNPYAENIIKNSKEKIIYFDDQCLEPYKEIAKIIGNIYKLSSNEIDEALKNFQPLPGRSNVIQGIRNTTIIDDTYNANPLSMKLAFRKLSAVNDQLSAKRKVIILGDMRELGDLSGKYHAEIYYQAKKIADLLITVGLEFRKIEKTNNFKNSQEASEYLLNRIKKDDIILVKGSRAIKMERIVDKLKLKD